jgi:hypothetical protein
MRAISIKEEHRLKAFWNKVQKETHETMREEKYQGARKNIEEIRYLKSCSVILG